MCWEQSPQQRTIATSRSEATTTESEPDNETTGRPQETLRSTNPKKTRRAPGATLTEQPRRKPFPLDRLFQERASRPQQSFPFVSSGGAGEETNFFVPSPCPSAVWGSSFPHPLGHPYLGGGFSISPYF